MQCIHLLDSEVILKYLKALSHQLLSSYILKINPFPSLKSKVETYVQYYCVSHFVFYTFCTYRFLFS